MSIPGLEEPVADRKAVDFEPLMKDVAYWKGRVADAKADLDAHEKELARAEGNMSRAMTDAGLPLGSSVTGSGFKFTIQEKFRAAYDPERWQEILSCAGASMPNLVQRRLNVTVLQELVENGMPMPPGCRLEAYKELAIRKQ